jgi:hypothetical protein
MMDLQASSQGVANTLPGSISTSGSLLFGKEFLSGPFGKAVSERFSVSKLTASSTNWTTIPLGVERSGI